MERIGHAVPAANAEIDRGRERLRQQPRLAEPGSTLDNDHRPDPRPQAGKAGQDRVELPVPTPQRRAADHGLASIPSRGGASTDPPTAPTYLTPRSAT